MMTRDDWYEHRKNMGVMLMQQGVSEQTAFDVSLTLMIEVHGEPPALGRWESTDMELIVEPSQQPGLVDIGLGGGPDGEWRFATTDMARAMGHALIRAADYVETQVPA